VVLGEPAQSEEEGGGRYKCESGNYSVGTKNLDHYGERKEMGGEKKKKRKVKK